MRYRWPELPPQGDDVKFAVLSGEPVEDRALPAIDAGHFWTVCRPGEPPTTCRYLVMAPEGIGCAKGTPLGTDIDALHARGEMRAQGDNCEGRIGWLSPQVWVRGRPQ